MGIFLNTQFKRMMCELTRHQLYLSLSVGWARLCSSRLDEGRGWHHIYHFSPFLSFFSHYLLLPLLFVSQLNRIIIFSSTSYPSSHINLTAEHGTFFLPFMCAAAFAVFLIADNFQFVIKFDFSYIRPNSIFRFLTINIISILLSHAARNSS